MNPDLHRGAPLIGLFSSDVWRFTHRGAAARVDYYRPLQIVVYRLTAARYGFSPTAFHALSILFAVATIVAAFGFFFKMSRRMSVAFVAAALFAVHPIHTEAVDWVSALPDIGCTLFLLIAFLLFHFAFEGFSHPAQDARSSTARLFALLLSLAAFAAALLWKETGAVFPLLVAAYVLLDSITDGVVKRLKSAAKFSLPYWGVLAGYLFLRVRMLGHIAASQRIWMLSGFQWGLTAIHLMMAYWWKLIAPVQLNAYYVFSPVTSLADLRAVAGILFVVLACGVIVYAGRRVPLLSFAVLWVFITLLPVMDIHAVGRNVFAERYLYLPSVGFCLFVALLAAEAWKRVPERLRLGAGISVLTAIVLLCALQTRGRNRDWKDNATLFAQTLKASPNAAFVQNMVAATQRDDKSGQSSAESHYWQALSLAEAELPPDMLQMAIACEGLAWVYSDSSDYSRALELLGRVRKIDPADPEVDGEEGLILARAGRWNEAETDLRRAIAASHENENVFNALGIIAWQHHHQLDEAADYFLRALEIHTASDDFNASLHNNLGAVYGEQGRFAAAIEQFKSAVAAFPDDPEYRTNLATAFAAAGRYDEARAEIKAALAISPGYDPARAVLERLQDR